MEGTGREGGGESGEGLVRSRERDEIRKEGNKEGRKGKRGRRAKGREDSVNGREIDGESKGVKTEKE